MLVEVTYDAERRGFTIPVVAVACCREHPLAQPGPLRHLAIDTGSTTTVLTPAALPGIEALKPLHELSGFTGRGKAGVADVHLVLPASGEGLSTRCSVLLVGEADHEFGVIGLDLIRELHIIGDRALVSLEESDGHLLHAAHPGRPPIEDPHTLRELMSEMARLREHGRRFQREAAAALSARDRERSASG